MLFFNIKRRVLYTFKKLNRGTTDITFNYVITKTPSKGSGILVEEKAERVKQLKVVNDNKKVVSSRASIRFSYKCKAIGTDIQNPCIQSQTEPQPGEGSWTHNPTPSQG